MDLEDSIDILIEQHEDINQLLLQSSQSDKKRFQRMKKRKADSLIEENHLKKDDLESRVDQKLLMKKLKSFYLNP